MRALVFAGCASALSLVVHAAAPTAQDPPQFRSAIVLVQVDVSVLDNRRRPIRGLTAADFEIVENGRPQTIAFFEAIDVPDAPRAPATGTWTRSTPRDVATNRFENRRLFVIVLDDQTVFDGLELRNAKEAARTAIEQIGPSDLAALLFINNVRDAEEFTSDHGKLLAAVEKFRPSWHIGISKLTALTRITAALAEVPNRRKSLIYIGPGEDFSIEVLTNAFLRPGADAPQDEPSEREVPNPFAQMQQIGEERATRQREHLLHRPNRVAASRPEDRPAARRRPSRLPSDDVEPIRRPRDRAQQRAIPRGALDLRRKRRVLPARLSVHRPDPGREAPGNRGARETSGCRSPGASRIHRSRRPDDACYR